MDRLLLSQGCKATTMIMIGIHMIDLRKIEGSFELEATHRF